MTQKNKKNGESRSQAVRDWLELHDLTAPEIARRIGLPGKSGAVTVERWLIGARRPTGLYARALAILWGDCPLV
jgi:transcriptional regulator with XRE-family HTH domain